MPLHAARHLLLSYNFIHNREEKHNDGSNCTRYYSSSRISPAWCRAAKEVAKTAGKDVYAKIKTFLEGRFREKPKAQQALANYEQKPELHKEVLIEVLCKEIKSDPAFAKQLQVLLQVGEDSGDMQVAVQVQDQGKAVVAKQVIGDIKLCKLTESNNARRGPIIPTLHHPGREGCLCQ